MQTSPKSKARMNAAAALTSVTIIAFSLTFVGVSLALLGGLLPAQVASLTANIDTGVVLLFVPLCALAFAIIFEVMRAALKGPVSATSPRLMPPLSNWRPGRGEG